jgi:hypothetical protein
LSFSSHRKNKKPESKAPVFYSFQIAFRRPPLNFNKSTPKDVEAELVGASSKCKRKTTSDGARMARTAPQARRQRSTMLCRLKLAFRRSSNQPSRFGGLKVQT